MQFVKPYLNCNSDIFDLGDACYVWPRVPAGILCYHDVEPFWSARSSIMLMGRLWYLKQKSDFLFCAIGSEWMHNNLFHIHSSAARKVGLLYKAAVMISRSISLKLTLLRLYRRTPPMTFSSWPQCLRNTHKGLHRASKKPHRRVKGENCLRCSVQRKGSEVRRKQCIHDFTFPHFASGSTEERIHNTAHRSQKQTS